MRDVPAAAVPELVGSAGAAFVVTSVAWAWRRVEGNAGRQERE
ncbi:hypothetical protein AB4039_13600 [Streptomyces sp. M-16]